MVEISRGDVMDEKNVQREQGVSCDIYTFTTNDIGKTIAINNRTGEVHETTRPILPVGTRFILPEELEAIRERKKRQAGSQERRDTSRKLGDFYFVKGEQEFPDLSPQTLARLVYLETYIGYADKTDKKRNKLMKTQKTQMRREDLPEVLGLSDTAVYEFVREVSPAYIMEDDAGFLYSNAEIFVRGALKRREYTSYQKFYRDGIQKIYRSVEKSQHRYLGYMFQMLPYINVEFNILCHNPDETDLDKIHPLTIGEFCNEIGFDVSHLNRLKNTYSKLRFDVDGKQVRFCAFVTDGGERKDMRIFINPRVLYAGTNYDKVEILGAFCH